MNDDFSQRLRIVEQELLSLKAGAQTHESVCSERYKALELAITNLNETFRLVMDPLKEKVKSNSEELKVLHDDRQKRLGAKSLLAAVVGASGGSTIILQLVLRYLQG